MSPAHPQIARILNFRPLLFIRNRLTEQAWLRVSFTLSARLVTVSVFASADPVIRRQVRAMSQGYNLVFIRFSGNMVWMAF
jgi:hypothetical protein